MIKGAKITKRLIFFVSLILSVTFLSVVSCGSVYAWSNTGGGDHGGVDWVISSDTTIAGNHYNIGTFRVNSGVTAKVRAYDGSNYGYVVINAANITVSGIIDASGKGYGGGGGGPGGPGLYSCRTCYSGSNSRCTHRCDSSCTLNSYYGSVGLGWIGGQNGKGSSYCFEGGTTSTCVNHRGAGNHCYNACGGRGGKGGGSYGGSGGVAPCGLHQGYASGGNGGNGGYLASASNGDSTVDDSVYMGSGGGGGGGGHTQNSGPARSSAASPGSGGGGAGGRGGGYVKLYASDILYISGKIKAKGLHNGGNGGSGHKCTHGSNVCYCDRGKPGKGGNGGSASSYGSSRGGVGVSCRHYYSSPSGGSGGGGAGGGILLKGKRIAIASQAVINNYGSDSSGNSISANGGTLKLFYGHGGYSNSGTIKTGKIKVLKHAVIDIGLKVNDGTQVVDIACEPEGTLTSPLRINKNGIIYGVFLVDVSDPHASNIRINTPSGVKALRKY